MSSKPRRKTSSRNRSGVVVICRGDSAGAPARTSRIIDALQKRLGREPLHLISYSAGASGLSQLGHAVDDLELGFDPVPWDLMATLGPRLREACPRLAIVVGEFSAVIACKTLGLKCVFLTDWLPAAELLSTQVLKHADAVIVMDNPGTWDVPPYLVSKIHFEGMIARESAPLAASDHRIASGHAPPGMRIAAIYDAAAPKKATAQEFFDAVAGACRSLAQQYPVTHLDWHDRVAWGPRFHPPEIDGIEVRQRPPELVVRPDLVLVTNTRLNVLECQQLGLRSISLGLTGNNIDDAVIARIASNTALKSTGLSAATLAECISSSLSLNPVLPEPDRIMQCRVIAIVDRILGA